MTKPTITVRGVEVTQATITGYSKKLGSVSEMFTVWANAAVLQAAQHGNRNWLDGLFATPLLHLNDGGLNKLGKQVLSYIQAHFPRVEWDKEGNRAVLKKYNAKSPYSLFFAVPGVTVDDLVVSEPNAEENGHNFPRYHTASGVEVEVELDKVLLPQGDFYLTFDEFINLPKAEKEDKPEPSIKAVTFAKSVSKVIEAQKAAKFVGSPEELAEALAQVKDLYMLLSGQHDAEVAAAQPIDVAKASELLKSGQGGKAIRAGGKVAPKADAKVAA